MSLSCLSSHFSLCVLMVTASFQSPNSSLKSQYILELIPFPYSQSGVNFWQGVYYPPSFSRFFATCCHPAKSFTTSCLNNIDSHLIDLPFPGLYFLSPSLLSPHHLPSSFPSYLSSLPPSFLSLFLPPALLLSLFPLSLSLILSPLVEEEYAKYKIILGYKNLFSP